MIPQLDASKQYTVSKAMHETGIVIQSAIQLLDSEFDVVYQSDK